MDEAALNNLDDFFSQYPLKQYHKGQILIYANEDPAGIFYLESGMVRKYDVSNEGEEAVLYVFRSNALFPIEWAVNRTSNKYFFEADTPIGVRRAPVGAFVDYIESHPSLTYSLLKQVHYGLEYTQRRDVLLMAGSPHSLILFELLVAAKRSGETRADGSCLVQVGTSDLAHRTGLSRETIGRELRKLTLAGDVVTREGRAFIIHNMQDLEKEFCEG